MFILDPLLTAKLSLGTVNHCLTGYCPTSEQLCAHAHVCMESVTLGTLVKMNSNYCLMDCMK